MESIRLKAVGGVLVVKVEGELDHHWAKEVRCRVDDFIESVGVFRIVFDFSKLSFMDSSGVGILMGRYKKMNEQKGSVAIACVSPAVDKLLNISGLKKILPVYNSLAEALNSN